MKCINKIFSGLNMRTSAVGGVLSIILSISAQAATDNGCSISGNDRINPEITLCSTHVYNIGDVKNPSNDADKQLIRDVVALKSTIMTQQLKKQYDFLEATISRFKTQLRKAILLSQLEAAGATTSSSSSSSASSDKNVVLSGAENCFLETTPSNGLDCIQRNIKKVLQAVSDGNINDAYRQLKNDIEFARSFGAIDNEDLQKDGGSVYPCNGSNLQSKADSVNQCAYRLNIAVMNAIDSRNNKTQQPNNNTRNDG